MEGFKALDHNFAPPPRTHAALVLSTQTPTGATTATGNLSISVDGSPSPSQDVGVVKHVIGGHVSNIPIDMYTKYSDLLAYKRDLKRKLKKFDEDFIAQWGRAPRKSDKEIIRPMYQKYHEVRVIALMLMH
jgi:hypothetical protein